MNEKQQRLTQIRSGTGVIHAVRSYAGKLAMLVVLLAGLAGQPLFAVETAGTTEKAKEAVRETSTAVQKAGETTAETAKDLWQRIDEARLKNRTRDELVAWVIMGVLVGAVAGMMTTLKPTGWGKLGRFVLGMAGAFLGGLVVHVGRFDFGWGPVLIRYEELFFSLVGAILILGLGRIIRSMMKRKPSPH